MEARTTDSGPVGTAKMLHKIPCSVVTPHVSSGSVSSTCLQDVTHLGFRSCPVPDVGFAIMHSDPGVIPQLLNAGCHHIAHPLWSGRKIDVVKTRQKFLCWTHPPLQRLQRCMLSQGEIEWHQVVTLFTPFAPTAWLFLKWSHTH